MLPEGLCLLSKWRKSPYERGLSTGPIHPLVRSFPLSIIIIGIVIIVIIIVVVVVVVMLVVVNMMSRKGSNLNSCCIFVQPESWFPHLTNTHLGCPEIHIGGVTKYTFAFVFKCSFILHHAFKAIYGYLFVYQSIFSHILQLDILNYIYKGIRFSVKAPTHLVRFPDPLLNQVRWGN